MSCNSQKSHEDKQNHTPGPITLVIHGGAGTIKRENMTPEKEKAYHEALKNALEAGFDVLEKGGKSADAVITAIKVMEDSPLFNAGRGAVFTNEGKNELDASIMDGSTLMAGAVAGVTTIKNPITAAYAVMTKSEHVMLIGKGAETFASEQGLEIVDPSYFFDSTRYKQLLKVKEKELERAASLKDAFEDPYIKDTKFGTVGAVALDQFGNIVAGTSTGGMTNKRYGRVGDAPIIGAGTYANNKTCGVSSTGWGEYFIRLSVARDIAAMMEYAGLGLQEAADSVIMKKLPALGGDGGIIALDRAGNVSMTFNTSGMYRGFIKKKGDARTFIYKSDE
ncbi:isoaspartyl peptidase/L-asparaginase family protein [Chryseosolibacter indicus]|uniref:Isoaspartyl peptidase/L-asparaginase n=1 Tax=Chryseosolibacter indicus TaxID=2782351 RepID=A0ABS5VQH7_9BACT|nr:isoaspartyl peptidase/L-asparaginase [Chryseosolibacter indicus]MBT1703109.1 isoaspartyl peptidase/L-asparaginase [Chryseosolibacter indicus]